MCHGMLAAMAGRSSSLNRCQTCWMRWSLCICPEIGSLRNEFQNPGGVTTRLVVLMHTREVKTTTNTARLASLVLPASEIRVRGRQGEVLSTEGIGTGCTPLFLYPAEHATELSHEWVSGMKAPFTLIVPDGNWRQASKVGNREAGLAQVPWVKLPRGRPSEYRLRREPDEESLSTFEAITRALAFLEGPEKGSEIQRKMEIIFRLMVERTLWMRGKIRAEDCTGGIPPHAVADRNGVEMPAGRCQAGDGRQ